MESTGALKLYVWRDERGLIAVAMASNLVEAKKCLVSAGYPEFHFVGYALQGESALVSPVEYCRPVGVAAINW